VLLRRILVLTLVALVGLPAAAASADGSLESLFQDDPRILGADTKVRDATLDEARALGVQRIRVTAFWNRIAPDPDAAAPPAGFDGANPNAYPAARWAVLDAAIAAIRARGMRVALNPTAPGPTWASSGVFDARLTRVTNPAPAAFGAFVAALGRRYDGTFVPAGATTPLPRIDHWSIWNEPNQGAWLAPQWTGTGKAAVPASPQQYRALAGAAWSALGATGHRPGYDTILVGDTAPKGAAKVTAASNAMPPITFLRRLYCVGDDLQLLRGAAATAVGCAATPDPAAFVAQNPALFAMTGWAHHPYELSLAPTAVPERPDDYVTMANLPLLEDQLDRVMARYAVKRRPVPLYLTEYGYQTDPPDDLGVSPAEQAAYLNGAEYRAWRDPRVRTLAQTLLVDAAPVGTGTSRWGSSFQTGLRYGPGSGEPGVAKPALAAYRVALVIPDRTVARDRRLRLWAHVRPGTGARGVELQVRGATGGYVRRRTLRTDADGFVSRTLTVRAGDRGVRLAIRDNGRQRLSREIAIRVPAAD
jgi:hypothetical protein